MLLTEKWILLFGSSWKFIFLSILSHSTLHFTKPFYKYNYIGLQIKNILICKRNNSMGIINQSCCYYSMLGILPLIIKISDIFIQQVIKMQFQQYTQTARKGTLHIIQAAGIPKVTWFPNTACWNLRSELMRTLAVSLICDRWTTGEN